MEFRSKSTHPAKYRGACLVLGLFEKKHLGESAQRVDKASNGFLSEVLKTGDILGEEGQTLMLYQVPGIESERVLLVGLGKRKEYTAAKLCKAVTTMVKQLNQAQAGDAYCAFLDELPEATSVYQATRHIVTAAAAAAYRFDTLKSDPKAPKKPLKRLLLSSDKSIQGESLEQAIRHGMAIAAGVRLTRDLANLPGNLCTPSYLAEQAQVLASQFPALQVESLDEAAMESLGMGALLSVARGSRQPPQLIVMKYLGGGEGQKPVVLVGKGITFDAGGISIKPHDKMDEMKFDMSGGASVIGTLRACLELALPINLIGVVPACENLPDGNANKPGDIVKSLAGLTIEVLNTDAEGRLILCDALTYCERFEPELVIDIATLTGACVTALGHHASGLLGNDPGLIQALLAAGERSGDRAWQLPLWEDYQSQLDSNFADIANIGTDAGAITAACFLSRFTKTLTWAHLDIAGTAWLGGKEKGATGRPVPLLVEFLLSRCQPKD
ncbi:MAG: leucyl aminopeptidase [Pseudomonadota bacterium]